MAHVQMTRRWKFGWGSAGTYLSFAVFTLVVLVPIYWMMRSAFSAAPDLIKLPLIYFPHPTLQNLRTLMEQIPFSQYLRNSLTFAISTTLLTLVVSLLAAYGFARIQFPGSGAILWILLLTMALPDVSTIVPLYQILKNLHLINKVNGITLMLSSTLTPFIVFYDVPLL